MYHATYGRVYIEGRDYSDDSGLEKLKYKSIIGYCPQENMLLDYFTIFEHLYLFGMVNIVINYFKDDIIQVVY